MASLFSFRVVDDRSFPYLRGINTFFDLFDDRNCRLVNLSGVVAIPGHLAVLFHESSTLCLFDAVPSHFRLSDVSSRLLVEILTKKKLASANNLTDLLLSTHSSPLVRVFFDKGPPLRLIAVQADGLLLSWDWFPTEWTWRQSCKFNVYQATFTSAPTSGKSIRDAAFSFGDKEFVVYLENSTNNLYIRNTQLPKLDPTKKRHEDSQLFPSSLQPSTLISNIPDPNGKLLLAKGGLWILSSSVYYYSFRSQRLVTIKYGHQKYDDDTTPTEANDASKKSTDDGPPGLTQIAAATIHPDTQELLLFDPRGYIFACSHDRLALSHVCSLTASTSPTNSPSPSPSNSSETSKVRIFAKHHLLYILQDGACKVHDLQSGAQMGNPSVPTQDTFYDWESSPGFMNASAGIWGYSGIWEVRTPPALKQAEMLATHTQHKRTVEYVEGLPHYVESQTGGAAPLCHDWGLDKWEAKYLLDTTLSTKSESVKREASRQLLPKLESPALILALLSSTQSDDFLLKELREFLEKYHGQGSNNEREQAKAAFLYHSPLNEKLAPLLDKYYKVAIDALIPPKESPGSLHHLFRNLTPNQILKQDATTWEMLCRAFPELFLQKLEEVVGLAKIEELYSGGITNLPAVLPVSRTLFEPEEGLPLTHAAPTTTHTPAVHSHAHEGPSTSTTTPRKAAIFETMVKLYYNYKPHLLPFFVQLVTRLFERVSAAATHRGSWTETTGPKPEFSKRALLALPPTPEFEISDQQLSCRFEILCATGNLADGVRLLLDFDRWDQALTFARQSMDHDVDHFVLFQILLTHALKARSIARMNQIWDIMPHGFGIFDLLTLVRHLLVEINQDEQGKVLAEDDEEILTIEVFRPQILKMWNASKQGESV